MAFNIFQSTAPGKKFKSTNFDLSHEVKLSSDMGKLAPVLCELVLPDDTFRMRSELFIRFAPMLAPIMHEIDAYMHTFFVPMRILWKDTEKFFTGGVSGEEAPVKPFINLTPQIYASLSDKQRRTFFGPGSLYDYLGYPVPTTADGSMLSNIRVTVQIDPMPFLAYYLIWYRFYRDQNLDFGVGAYDDSLPDVSEQMIEEYVQGLDSGEVDFLSTPFHKVLFTLQWRAWEKDYFTSALPWAQRGPELMIPGITPGNGSGDVGSLSIEGNGDVTVQSGLTDPVFDLGNSAQTAVRFSQFYGDDVGGVPGSSVGIPIGSFPNGEYESGIIPDIKVTSEVHSINGTTVLNSDQIAKALKIVQNDVARMRADDADFGTINNLRRMFAIQRYTEAEARGGSRFPEWLQQIWGTNPGDYRLQNPTYLGGGKTKVVVSEVLQQSATSTAPDGAEMALGDFAGRAVTAGGTRRIGAKFREYGFIITILSIKPRSSYMQGMPRKFQLKDKFDYANPYLAHLGEQEVKNQELYFNFNGQDSSEAPSNDDTFGYQSRYSEYKFCPNRVCGDMRTNLDFWHLTRKFSFAPGLNRQFVYINPDHLKRIYAVEDQAVNVDEETGESYQYPLDHLYIQVYHHITAKRKLPRYGVPS
ncbi:major capsid protein [Dipodfec virus UOA04_Rod_931]|nr:major capsid protein [Dipodfec virus UOA04_Rod_931]